MTDLEESREIGTSCMTRDWGERGVEGNGVLLRDGWEQVSASSGDVPSKAQDGPRESSAVSEPL